MQSYKIIAQLYLRVVSAISGLDSWSTQSTVGLPLFEILWSEVMYLFSVYFCWCLRLENTFCLVIQKSILNTSSSILLPSDCGIENSAVVCSHSWAFSISHRFILVKSQQPNNRSIFDLKFESSCNSVLIFPYTCKLGVNRHQKWIRQPFKSVKQYPYRISWKFWAPALSRYQSS